MKTTAQSKYRHPGKESPSKFYSLFFCLIIVLRSLLGKMIDQDSYMTMHITFCFFPFFWGCSLSYFFTAVWRECVVDKF